jgi:hypothetical protein
MDIVSPKKCQHSMLLAAFPSFARLNTLILGLMGCSGIDSKGRWTFSKDLMFKKVVSRAEVHAMISKVLIEGVLCLIVENIQQLGPAAARSFLERQLMMTAERGALAKTCLF